MRTASNAAAQRPSTGIASSCKPGPTASRVLALAALLASPGARAQRSDPVAAWWRTEGHGLWIAVLVAAMVWWLFALRLRALARRERARFEDRLRERERIARELHDTLLQGTQGLVLNLQVVAGEMPREDERRRRLEALLDDADATIASARDRVHDLRDLRADIADLVAALSALGSELSLGTAIRFELSHTGDLPALDPDVGTEMFYIAREALVNAFRHAQARAIEVGIERVGETLRVTVSDNGRGVDPVVIEARGRPGHWGMRGMHERARRIRARLGIFSLDHGGTQVLLELPLRLRLSQRLSGDVSRMRRWVAALFERHLNTLTLPE